MNRIIEEAYAGMYATDEYKRELSCPEHKDRIFCFKGHFYYGDEWSVLSPDVPRIYTTILRNPIQRVLSSFAYFKRFVWEEEREITLEEFLKGDYIIGSNHMVHILTQGTNKLEDAKAALSEIDYVGFLEDMEPYILELSEALNWPRHLDIVVQNQLGGTRQKHELTELEKGLLVHYNQKDIQLYEWAINSCSR
jgi:hypothetical protein